jgi:diaminopimelate decarboxylase
MHPVKSRRAITAAYFDHGVRTFALDTHEELDKILDATGRAKDLNLWCACTSRRKARPTPCRASSASR